MITYDTTLFVTRAKEVHGDRYTYDEVVYVNATKKVKIWCNTHQAFFYQSPTGHLHGTGCKQCRYESYSAKRRSNIEEFITKAKAVHGDRYDYSKSVYIGANHKLKIICPVHGDFEQNASNHLFGNSCPECRNDKLREERQFTTEEYIAKAKEVRGDRYDYSKVNYLGQSVKITIVCPIHGDFEQYPGNHLKGHGCAKCGFIYTNSLKRFTQDEYIERARKVHGDRYSYSKVKYVDQTSMLTIGCPVHGDFQQSAHSHISGKICFKCSVDSRTGTTEQFIEKAKKIHGDLYGYDLVKYVNSNTHVDIVCKKHGVFSQLAKSHISSRSGCPTCKASKGELAIKAILDKYTIQHITEYKIPGLLNYMAYDFYLPEHNTLIEFHGRQHYAYIPHFHERGEIDFLAQKNRDKSKKYIANRARYRLLEFNYKHLDLGEDEFEKLVLTKLKFNPAAVR